MEKERKIDMDFSELRRKYGMKGLAVGSLLTAIGAFITAAANGSLDSQTIVQLLAAVSAALAGLGLMGARANGVASQEVSTNPMSPLNDLPVPPIAQ